ncbi:outer dense fiber protein 2-like isoform X3 [Littorina saxatilis]|uniref:Outer dense fiber protein 2 n=1 Tax=Littorina saxatilis TaxID=31220 RepID=A0AAN9AY42_9CAEN
MTLERGLRPTSPVHVHVDETTPVHVHMMKRVKKPKSAASTNGMANRRPRSTRRAVPTSTTARARSSSPKSGPWVPAPGKATRGSRITWQVLESSCKGNVRIPRTKKSATAKSRKSDKSPTHRMDLQDRGDLSTEEEDAVHGQMKQYEDKIDTLMSHVGTLKNEVELQRALHELDAREDLLDTSHRTIEKQEATLHTIEAELSDREKENYLLRKSVDITKFTYTSGPPLSQDELEEDSDFLPGDFPQEDFPQGDSPYGAQGENQMNALALSTLQSEKEHLNHEREQLMKKLIEVEMDGQAAQQHVRELRDVIRRLREDNRLSMSSVESVRLAKLKEAFFEKMADFEATNRALRRLLRAHHRSEGEAARLAEQRELLLRKAADGDVLNERLHLELRDRDRVIEELRTQVVAQREESMALSNLQDSLEATRAHLQKQLRQKEGDCNRMAVQIRTIEGQLAQSKIEMDHLQDLVNTAKQRADNDKEALKKATRAQKQRAERGEGELERMRGQLMEKDGLVNELTAQLSIACSRLEKESLQKEHAEVQRSALEKRIEELEALVDRVEDNSKAQIESLTARLHDKAADLTTLKLENERLKSTAITTETRLSTLEEEASRLRESVKQYEQLTGEYKGQMDRSRREADDSMVLLEEHQKETSRLHHSSEVELEKVKTRLHQRLQELEPLPDLLRTTELRLHEANEKLLAYERRNTENTKLIAELTAKFENRGEAVDSLRSKFSDSQEESRLMHAKMDATDRRLKELDDVNKELVAQVARKDEALHQLNLRLEEKGRESGVLTRQLENALSDLRQQQDNVRDRFASKERTYQSRIADLESQLSQARAEIARIKREKEENERKFNSRLFDLKDRLEQSHSTNRSMQNYVQFLKNSYANVFGETAPYGPSPLKPTLP